LLARLAVDRRHKGRGLGEYLLMHALDRVLATADNIGVQCVAEFTGTPLRLVLPLATIRQA